MKEFIEELTEAGRPLEVRTRLRDYDSILDVKLLSREGRILLKRPAISVKRIRDSSEREEILSLIREIVQKSL